MRKQLINKESLRAPHPVDIVGIADIVIIISIANASESGKVYIFSSFFLGAKVMKFSE